MTEKQKSGINETEVIVALIAALGVILTGYWQFVWRPSHSTAPDPTVRRVDYLGRVVDDQTRQPVEGAKVTLDLGETPRIAYTDTEGVYRFTIEIEESELRGRVRVDADGYEVYDRNITLLSEDSTIEDIRLTAQ